MASNERSPLKLRLGGLEPFQHNLFGPHEPSTFSSFETGHLAFSLVRSQQPYVYGAAVVEQRGRPSPKRSREHFEQFPSQLSILRQAKRRALAEAPQDFLGFSHLPDEIKKYIFSFLDQPDAAATHTVCWNWARYASDDYVWSALYCRRWSFHPEQDPWLRNLQIPFKLIFRDRLLAERERMLDGFGNSFFHNDLTSSQIYHKRGELFSKEAALHGTPIEVAKSLYTIALQEFHTAHVLAPDNAEILVFWGDTISDLAALVPVSSSGRALLNDLSRIKYDYAKRLSDPMQSELPLQPALFTDSRTRSSILEDLAKNEVTWDNFYSDSEKSEGDIDKDDRMDVS